MKCLVLAGGRGERLWPLSRNDFPKQFIRIQKNHSLFQETIARNLPYCDEFIILTCLGYKDIISNQMEAFQGVSYRCIYEEKPRKTTAAIVLACMDLQPSEYVFVVAADHLIGSTGYKEAVLQGKEGANKGRIVLFGKSTEEIDRRFGYISEGSFFEKPDTETAEELKHKKVVQNIGLILCQNGVLLNEVHRCQNDIFTQCKAIYAKRRMTSEGTYYDEELLDSITPISIEKSILEKTDKLLEIPIQFAWDDIGSLEDLNKTGYTADGIGTVDGGKNSMVLNTYPDQAVVVNGLDDVLVVNTRDAIYIGKKGTSYKLKDILRDHDELKRFADAGACIYRSWGYREIILEEEKLRVQRVTVLPGKTIHEHKHAERTENWTIVQGSALIVLDGVTRKYRENDNVTARVGVTHQISNNGTEDLVFIETATGEILRKDLISSGRESVTEAVLGLQIDPMVKMMPVFKDYLWGGTKLRDVYGKKCEFDTIAESWELSAHPAGNSIVASGKHKGLAFGKYLDTVGKEVLGWKCMPLQMFPLLIKLIDAKENLSIQVHPNDEYALENENEYGKNELWYVIDTEPDAGLYLGFRRDVSREEVECRVKDHTILDILNFYHTHPGDVFFIPAGTVHAIGAGNLICEIQQSSNSTYRLYDYNRRDKFGNLRDLHLEKALDVLSFKKYERMSSDAVQEDGRIKCKYFETMIVKGDKRIALEDESFYSVTCISGAGTLHLKNDTMSIRAGETVFIPAVKDSLDIQGQVSILITKV